MQMFDWTTDGDARTTEGWVKHDLERGELDTYWLNNAAVDAVSDAARYGVTPDEYLIRLLDNVDVPEKAKVRALAHALCVETNRN